MTPAHMAITAPQIFGDADAAFAATLSNVLQDGLEVEAASSSSVGSDRSSRELLNYHIVITDPRNRLVSADRRAFLLPGAVARFVWMMAANNRLADIEFYWGQRVARFSDDGILVPGSSYGARMLQPRPGLDQIRGVIDRLRSDNSSRRGAISIYQPEDAIRESIDIPCAFGLFYHVRSGALQSTVVMRSNNAMMLMPYNIFEFSLLSEVVAAELRLPMGRFCYSTVSMHIYSDNYERARAVAGMTDVAPPLMTPTMPSDPSPIEQIRTLVRLESEARHAASGFSEDNFDTWLIHAENGLHPYWRQYYYLLVLHTAKMRNMAFALDRLSTLIASPWSDFLGATYFRTEGEYRAASGDLFDDTKTVLVVESNALVERMKSLEILTAERSEHLLSEGHSPISFTEFRQLRKELVGEPGEPGWLAARELSTAVTREEFDHALAQVRPPGDG